MCVHFFVWFVLVCLVVLVQDNRGYRAPHLQQCDWPFLTTWRPLFVAQQSPWMSAKVFAVTCGIFLSVLGVISLVCLVWFVLVCRVGDVVTMTDCMGYAMLFYLFFIFFLFSLIS